MSARDTPPHPRRRGVRRRSTSPRRVVAATGAGAGMNDDDGDGGASIVAAGTGAGDATPHAVLITKPGGYNVMRYTPVPGGTAGATLTVGAGACPAPPGSAVSPFDDLGAAVAPMDRLVLVDIAAAGVNYADVCIRHGLYTSANTLALWPLVPGFEFSGRVVAAAPDSGFAAGDIVYGVTMFGGYSTRVTVPASQLFRLPPELSVDDGAATLAVFLTAWYALFHMGGFSPAATADGRAILVHSAAGGVGGMLCQLGRVIGCRVVGVVGTSAKVAYAAACGCDVVIDKSMQELWPAVAAASPRGYQAVFDANGVSTLKGSWACVAPTGRLVVYGFASMLPKHGGVLGLWQWVKIVVGYLCTPRFNPLTMTSTNRSVMAFNLSFLFDHNDILHTAVADLHRWLASGAVTPAGTTAFPLAHAADAHAAIESGLTTGKLVLHTPLHDAIEAQWHKEQRDGR